MMPLHEIGGNTIERLQNMPAPLWGLLFGKESCARDLSEMHECKALN